MGRKKREEGLNGDAEKSMNISGNGHAETRRGPIAQGELFFQCRKGSGDSENRSCEKCYNLSCNPKKKKKKKKKPNSAGEKEFIGKTTQRGSVVGPVASR